MEPIKVYSTKELIENLNNALENGYDQLDEDDIAELLLMSDIRPTTNAADSGKAPSKELEYLTCEKCGHQAKYPACAYCGNAIPLPPNYSV